VTSEQTGAVPGITGPAPDVAALDVSAPDVGAPGETVVDLRGITKRFGDLVANDAVDFELRRGEVHALLGENGAGKTTLMRILYGLTGADVGEIRIVGRPVRIHSPKEAIAVGIGMVTQHFSLVRPMTVTENVVLGRTGRLRVDIDAAAAQVVEASARFGIAVHPHAIVGELSVRQQRVEILKALARDCRVLILDEPTAVLVPHEVDALFETLRRLVADGLAVVFISHKLGEVRAISHRVSVLRRGRMVGTVPGTTDERELARMMVGRPMIGVARTGEPAGEPAVATHGAEVRLVVRDLSALGAAGGRPGRVVRGAARRDPRRRRCPATARPSSRTSSRGCGARRQARSRWTESSWPEPDRSR
jgi:simple sugar transport system ATP-binding protein